MDPEKLKTWLDNLRHPETWITGTGLLLLEVLAVSATTWVLSYLELPKLRQLWLLLGVTALVAVAWWLIRAIYWRWGFGRKVGISLDAYLCPMHQWAEARRELSRLCSSYAREQKIRLKLLPPHMTETEEQVEKAKRRYNMPIVFRVTMSPRFANPDQSHMTVKYSVSFGKAVSNEFVQATNQYAKRLCQKPQPESAKQALQYHGASLFELILLYLAVIDHVHRRDESAARFLQRLDDCIAPRFKANEPPRDAFRWLAGLCLTNLSAFPGDSPPEPDDLLRMRDFAQEAASRYGEENPSFYNPLARNLFFLRDLEGALAVTDLALAKRPFEQPGHAICVLNKAVLSLLLGRYKDAVRAFDQFVQTGQLKAFKWRDDLLKFADGAYADGYPDAIYLRALYRKVIGERLTKDLSQRLERWFAGNPERDGLAVFYRDRMPSLASTPVVKQQSRRRKGRKR